MQFELHGLRWCNITYAFHRECKCGKPVFQTSTESVLILWHCPLDTLVVLDSICLRCVTFLFSKHTVASCWTQRCILSSFAKNLLDSWNCLKAIITRKPSFFFFTGELCHISTQNSQNLQRDRQRRSLSNYHPLPLKSSLLLTLPLPPFMPLLHPWSPPGSPSPPQPAPSLPSTISPVTSLISPPLSLCPSFPPSLPWPLPVFWGCSSNTHTQKHIHAHTFASVIFTCKHVLFMWTRTQTRTQVRSAGRADVKIVVWKKTQKHAWCKGAPSQVSTRIIR